MDKREEKRYQSERMRRRRRRRRKQKFLKALVSALILGTAIFLLIVIWKLGSYLIREKSFGDLTVSWLWESLGPDIILDAGHGGKDQGASSGEVLEKDLTLEITKRTENVLKEAGYKVSLIRKEDKFVDLHERTEEANRRNSKVFVSIHCNSLEEGQADGIETYYAQSKEADSQMLAEAIQNHASDQTQAFNRGVKTADYVVIKETEMPAALIEVGFLNDAAERALLQQEDYQQKLAEGIAAGILDYLESLESSEPEKM